MQKLHKKAAKQLNVAVLMGGISEERNVSLLSGKAVVKALQRRNHRVTAVDISEKSIEIVKQLDPDVAFIALHGRFGEDGVIQSMLDEEDILYTGSGAQASRLGMDKKASKRRYLASAVPTAPYTVLNSKSDEKSIIRQAKALGFPLVCKPSNGGSSIGIQIADDAAALSGIITRWGKEHKSNTSEDLILEKHIHGRELTVGVIDGEALPVVEIVSHNKFFDYSAKYEDEHTQYLLPVSMIESVHRKICDSAVRAYKATGCRHMARVDMIYGYDGDVYVLEVNTIPGLTPRSLLPMAANYAGIAFSDLCEKICMLAVKELTQRDLDKAENRKTA